MKLYIKTFALSALVAGATHAALPLPDINGFIKKVPSQAQLYIAHEVEKTASEMGMNLYPNNPEQRALNKCGTQLLAQNNVSKRYNIRLEIVIAACKAAAQ